MIASALIKIYSPKEKIWEVITDIENSANNIEGIDKIEILNKPIKGLLDLKWKETRTMFGKEATEIMWITDAEENHYYKTRAESHGSIYVSEMRIIEEEDHCVLKMSFSGEAVSLFAKISKVLFSKMMRKSMEKVMLKDLEDIKEAVNKK